MTMHMKLILAIATLVSVMNRDVLGQSNAIQQQINLLVGQLNSTPMDAILYWNLVAVQAVSNDWNSDVVNIPDQKEATIVSRALAIIHGVMHDSMVILNRELELKSPLANRAAIMEAAYQTLSSLFPKQRTIFDAVRTAYLNQIMSSNENQTGLNVAIATGNLIAAYALTDRESDGSTADSNCIVSNAPGYHQPDPLHPNQGCIGARWGNVKPFGLDSATQFRVPSIIGDTPASRLAFLNSTRYAADFAEVKSLGSKTSTVRTADQTQMGIFWGYDGVPIVGVSPRFYNQITRVIAIQQNNTLEQNARLFAVMNYAVADAGIAIWHSKYYYNLWRPIIGIRQATGNINQADPNWEPLGAPANGNGTYFTPPFPPYLSGHGGFGSACFETLRRFYGRDNIAFQLQSDEYNGQTIDANTGMVRPVVTRNFSSFTQAERENHDSRIYLGVHWRIDQDDALIVGRQVGSYVFDKFERDPLSFLLKFIPSSAVREKISLFMLFSASLLVFRYFFTF